MEINCKHYLYWGISIILQECQSAQPRLMKTKYTLIFSGLAVSLHFAHNLMTYFYHMWSQALLIKRKRGNFYDLY